MNDKEAAELWVAIEQIAYALISVDESVSALANRDKSISRIYHTHFKRHQGAIETLMATFWRNRKLEEGA